MNGFRSVFVRVNLRHLRRHRLRTFLTIAGIAAGVALTFSISLINTTLLGSFRASIRSLAGSAELEVSAPDQSGLPAEIVDRIETVPGVDNAVPVLRSTTRVSGFEGSRRLLVLGATPEFSSLAPSGLGPLSELRIRVGGEATGLLLAEQVARELGVGPGDRVAVETPSGPRGVPVAGTVGGGLVSVLNGGDVGVMLLGEAQETFAKRNRVDSIYVVADPDVPLNDVEASIDEAIGGAGVVGPPGERGQGLERVFASLGTLLSMGGTVALFVALFVVYNTMSMSLAERRREISMALAFGALRKDVFGAFLAEAAVLGTIASVLGLAGGYGLATILVEQAVAAYRFLPLSAAAAVKVTSPALILAGIAGIAVSIAGAFVPARRVLGVAPIESLRPDAAYEWERASQSVRSRRATFGFGVVGLIASGAALAAFFAFPESRWIVTAGLVCGLAGVTFVLPEIVPLSLRVVRVAFARVFGTVGRLSSDALAKNPGRSTFTIAALVLTLGLVVAVASALGSYRSQIERTAGALIGAPLYVTSDSYTGITSDQPLDASVRETLESVPGVDYVYPLRFAFLDLGSRQALLYAVPVERAITEGATTDLEAVTDDPEGFLAGLRAGGIVVSRLTAERLDLAVGDELALPTPSGERSFEVGGIFDDLVSFDSFYLSYPAYVDAWNDPHVDEFGVIPEPGTNVQELSRDLESAVADDEIPASVFSEEELLGRILDTVEGTFSLANGIQLAALVVAALTIANTMFTAVLERRWEMGLERAIGMSSTQLSRGVLIEAAGIGIVGGLGGALLGTVSGFFMTRAMEAQFAWRVPFEAPWALIVACVVAGVAIAGAAGVFPSRLAVRAPIIESLRYE